MYRFLFISLFAIASLVASAQSTQNSRTDAKTQKEDEEEERVKPTVTVIKDQGLSLGIDVAPFIMRIFQDENTGFAFIGRYGLKNRWWANGELGYEKTKFSNENYSYKSNGTFIRLGLDYDLFMSEDFPTNDNVFVGFRYCYSWQNHKSDYFKIVDSYWGDYSGSVGSSAVNSHSLDLVFGIRCEMLRYFYMGWSFRCMFLMASAHDNNLDPYSVAGFGRADSRVALGFTYTFEYQLPINKFRKR